MKWSNWAGNVQCEPTDYHEPTTEEELVALVKQVAQKGERIKVVGAGHSFSRIAACDGSHLVSLQRYQQVLEVNREAGTVTVQAGIWLKDLNEFLATKGLALSNMGIIAEQSLAGAISTATHGTSTRFGSLAQQVVALSLVTASGEVISASKEQNPELFAAAQVSLGSLGILSTITLLCEPAFNLHAIQAPSDFDRTLEKLERGDLAEYFGFWWMPHTDDVCLWAANRTNQKASKGQNQWLAWFNDILLGNYLHEAALWVSSFMPSLVPTVNRSFHALLYNRQQEQIGRSDHVFMSPVVMRQMGMEYAIPIEHTATALRQLRNLIQQEQMKIHLPVDVRFSAADDAWLSPASGRMTCYIGMLVARPFGRDVPYETYFRQIEALMSKFSGRPHWGKLHYRTASDLQPLYPKWDAFQQLRTNLDPNGLFMNDYLERVLGEP